MVKLKPFLLFLCITVSTDWALSDDCRIIQYERPTKDKVLRNHIIKSTNVQGQNICEILCYQEAHCVSYNYGPMAGSETPSCELNDRSHLQVSNSDFVQKEGYIYRDVLNFCKITACRNNATCQTGFTAKRYRCICSQGYQGEHCEADIEECVDGSHNCSTNAICVNVPGSFQCQCRTGYTGDGIDCTAQPPTAVNCVSLTKVISDDAYEVDANHGVWPSNGFCRVLSQAQINAGDPYTMTVQLLNVRSSQGVDFGHPGVMYNVIDEDNFDLIYFRPHNSGSGCYQLGYVVNRQWTGLGSGSCPNGPPRGLVWFTIRVVVFSNKIVNIYFNNALVTSLMAHHNTKGRGGVLVANGYANVIKFKDFSLTANV